MIDADVYMAKLLEQSYAAVVPPPSPMPEISPELDTDEIGALPAIVWWLTGSGQTSNGPGLWNYELHVNIFGDGLDQAKAAMRTLYDVVHGWDDEPSATMITVDGTPICVSSVDDVDLPSRFPSADVPGRNVRQYSGSFPIALRG